MGRLTFERKYPRRYSTAWAEANKRGPLEPGVLRKILKVKLVPAKATKKKLGKKTAILILECKHIARVPAWRVPKARFRCKLCQKSLDDRSWLR